MEQRSVGWLKRGVHRYPGSSAMVSSIDDRLLIDCWTKPAVGINSDIVHLTHEQVAGGSRLTGGLSGAGPRRISLEMPRGCHSSLPATSVHSQRLPSNLNRRVAIWPWPSTLMTGCTTGGTMPAETTSWLFSASGSRMSTSPNTMMTGCRTCSRVWTGKAWIEPLTSSARPSPGHLFWRAARLVVHS
jgi:hypothetical protein